jgi:hypothetical protein
MKSAISEIWESTVELVDPVTRIRERLAALRRASVDGLEVEVEPPPRRIAPPSRPEPPVMDAE